MACADVHGTCGGDARYGEREEDVGRFEVSVHNALGMEVLDTGEDM